MHELDNDDDAADDADDNSRESQLTEHPPTRPDLAQLHQGRVLWVCRHVSLTFLQTGTEIHAVGKLMLRCDLHQNIYQASIQKRPQRAEKIQINSKNNQKIFLTSYILDK